MGGIVSLIHCSRVSRLARRQARFRAQGGRARPQIEGMPVSKSSGLHRRPVHIKRSRLGSGYAVAADGRADSSPFPLSIVTARSRSSPPPSPRKALPC